MIPIIDEDGEEQTYTAVYWVYGSKRQEECDTLREAVGMLRSGSDGDLLWPEAVLGPEGQVVLDTDGIFAYEL